MKIAFYNIFGEKNNAEQEILMRLKYVFLKNGHEFIEINRDGYLIDKSDFHIELVCPDLLFTFNAFDLSVEVVPDVYSAFFHWTPIGFFINSQSKLLLESLNSYDSFGSIYEKDIFRRILGVPAKDVSEIGSSVPVDYMVQAKYQEKRKIFYAGINFERVLQNMRYGELLKKLDETNELEIYGPKKVYGRKNMWTGFRSYKGEIPFDGYSIIKKINQAGVCLALNSPMHNDANAVSNRTFEAAAAGAVIISDDNAFVRRMFGDSVFYIDRQISEEEASDKIIRYLEWINGHPKESYYMAKKAQKIFAEKLSLDVMVKDFIKQIFADMKNKHDVHLQEDWIDVVCYFDSAQEFYDILKQVEKQYYQKLHLILVTNIEAYQNIKGLTYEHDVIESHKESKGNDFIQVKKVLRGKYFMFIDKYSILHARHIYKNHQVISKREELFVYSGSYVKKEKSRGKKYIVLNSKSITRDEFLLFSCVTNRDLNWQYHDQQAFFVETIFSRSSGLFRHEILEYVDEDELSMISDNVHHYLACCSLIKGKQLGRFTYAITTGYMGDSVAEMEKKVFGYRRRHWYSNGRAAKTYIKEFNEIFFKYNFECNHNNVRFRDFSGEKTRYSEFFLPVTPERAGWRAVYFIKKIIPQRAKTFLKKILYS